MCHLNLVAERKEMAGIVDPESQELQEESEFSSSFVWDDNSQLYFHAGSGFYHDPNAGWYYSSKDGLYYKFENGEYVLLESDKGDESETLQCTGTLSYEATLDEPCNTECSSSHGPENPRPTSEWLEDTLIDLYLSGYSNPALNAANDVRMPLETDDSGNFNVSADGAGDSNELEEGEWIPEDNGTDQSETGLDEGASWDEENWKAQYGQVVHSGEESLPHISVVDLWDWAMVMRSKMDGKEGEVAKLVGRLVKRSAKLHPSMPSGGGLLKTAPICEVHLDLVRVTSGRVYKLRRPSARYLASLSIYDSSNPTKDWGFPKLSLEWPILPLSKSTGNCEPKTADGVYVREDLSVLSDIPSTSGKHGNHAYRDRAAERRNLHGGFGIGPGQKNAGGDLDSPSSPVSACTEEAAADALNMSFGANSYARRILENMGWKEGEALGKTTKGLLEPLQAVGNKGNAGLGWAHGRT